jgi:hypothetical protein
MDRRTWIRTAGVLVAGAALYGCGGGDDGDDGAVVAPVVVTVGSDGATSLDATALAAALATYPLGTLSSYEAESLAFMREEEQMAHDVYAVSATLWQPPIFANIGDSEATHAAAVKLLLDRYQLPDPLAGLPAGTFKTPQIQALYDAFVARSRVNLVSALTVGAEIEEMDIVDIQRQMANIDNADILMVYGHLLRGSRNHLRAFVSALAQRGVTYVPQYLSQTAFDAIVASPIETGP